MVQCKTCGADFIPGTLFCKACGRPLFEETVAAEPTNPTPTDQLHYLLPASGRRGTLNLTEPVWVGRADPENGYWPGLDLTDDDGLDLGVSRRHARIQMDEDEIVIFDKDSANGTWIDKERLSSEQPYSLPATAIVRFGRLVVHFFRY